VVTGVPQKSENREHFNRTWRHADGTDVARSWFGKATIAAVTADTVTIEMPGKLQQSRLQQSRARSEFADKILDCGRKLAPGVQRLNFTISQEAA
jgi:hypothetical protein